MAEEPQARLADKFAADARTYAADLAAASFLFVSVSLMAGRVWRFAFDDEVMSLTVNETHSSVWQVFEFFVKGGDMHPPLSFAIFYLLHDLGIGAPGMRLASLAMTAAALALLHLLTLNLIAAKNGAAVRVATRMAAVLLFGLVPMAIGLGDAIRWYPLFALLFALFLTLYLAGGTERAKFASSVALGLAASTNFLAILVAVPFAIYRYGLEKKFRPAFDIAYWLVVAAFGSLGVWSAYSIAGHGFHHIENAQFDRSIAGAIASMLLGFFGGNALGIGRAWILVPAILITAYASVTLIDLKRPAAPVHLLLLMLVAMAAMLVLGFAKPRSFLYLAPVAVAVQVIFLDSNNRGVARTMAPLVLLLAPAIATATNIEQGAQPFKRESVIPFQEIVDFISINEKGRVLVVSSDPVVNWMLDHQDSHQGRCVSRFLQGNSCFDTNAHYDSIVVVYGHSNRSKNAAYIAKFDTQLAGLLAGRQKIAGAHFGRDDDAPLKSRLTGVPLETYILTVDLYR